MNEEAKIRLSALEMEVVNDTEWIFTKQLIIKKVSHLLGNLHEDYKKIIFNQKDLLPGLLQRPGGKISKGENYKGLPYLILDYPATFSKEKIFAIRTMFWWGNFFSISLHLSGNYFKSISNIENAISFLKEKDFWVSVNEDEWQHHFHSSNFKNINELNEVEIKNIFQKKFLKIAKKTGFSQWNAAPQFLTAAFIEITEFIKLSFPNGEKDL
ncbi:MAG: hypothetical protein ABI267_01965 [Ginsengibacter sp.]